MGAVNSTGKLDRALAADLPEDERYFGLENFGNTCYCNSVLQALYFCEPFRKAVLEYERNRQNTKAILRERSDRGYGSSSYSYGNSNSNSNSNSASISSAVNGTGVLKKVVGMGSMNGDSATNSNTHNSNNNNSSVAGSSSGAILGEETMLTALAELFHQISSHKKRTGSVPPKSFVSKLRQQNELFSSYMHQDAHEFLNFILNDIVECLRKEAMSARNQSHRLEMGGIGAIANGLMNGHGSSNKRTDTDINSANNDELEQEPVRTFVHDLFEGKLSNEVRCLCCETVTQRIESFFDLSVDVEQNSSLTACLRNFSSTELLREQDKFYCDMCCSLQEAERRMRVKILPKILSLHLKRFKFMEQFKKYKKLSYRVVFPLELRLCNTSDDAEDPDRLYSLFAVVVHVGSGPNQGHYISLIKSHNQWLMFDDDCVEIKAESELQSVFGMTQDSAQSTEAGYILFYEQISSNT